MRHSQAAQGTYIICHTSVHIFDHIPVFENDIFIIGIAHGIPFHIYGYHLAAVFPQDLFHNLMADIGAFVFVETAVELYDFPASASEEHFRRRAASLFVIGADQRNISRPVPIHAHNRFPIPSGEARNGIHTGDQPVHCLFFQHFHEFNLPVHDIYRIADNAFIIMSGQLEFNTPHHPGKERMLQAGYDYPNQPCFPAGGNPGGTSRIIIHLLHN